MPRKTPMTQGLESLMEKYDANNKRIDELMMAQHGIVMEIEKHAHLNVSGYVHPSSLPRPYRETVTLTTTVSRRKFLGINDRPEKTVAKVAEKGTGTHDGSKAKEVRKVFDAHTKPVSRGYLCAEANVSKAALNVVLCRMAKAGDIYFSETGRVGLIANNPSMGE